MNSVEVSSAGTASYARDRQPADCPLCQRPGASHEFTSRDRAHGIAGVFAIHHCAGCNAYFIQPWLDAECLSRYYPEDYGRFRHGESLKKKSYQGWQRFILENHYGYPGRAGSSPNVFSRLAAAFCVRFTAKDVLPYHGGGKILDVGCGGGGYLYRLKQWGWQTYGVEPSATGAQQARKLGLDVRQGMLEEAGFAGAFFDVVRMSNVLEHLPNPKRTLEEIRRILKPDGLVYLTVPNTSGLGFRLFRENWYALETPRHVISYSPKTLQLLAHASGFEVLRQDFTAGPFNFVRSLKYYFDENASRYPAWLVNFPWQRSKAFRRVLKPWFFFVDRLGYGDFLHATLGRARQD